MWLRCLGGVFVVAAPDDCQLTPVPPRGINADGTAAAGMSRLRVAVCAVLQVGCGMLAGFTPFHRVILRVWG